MKALAEYRGTRVQLQRLVDGLFFSGWVIDLTPGQFIVRLNSNKGLDPGDRVYADVHGLRCNLQMTLELSGQTADSCIFTLVGPPKIVESRGAARVLAPPMKAELTSQGMTHVVTLHDISEYGFGFTGNVYFEAGELVEMKTTGPTGEMVVLAQIRHCRTATTGRALYRGGAMIQDVSRVSRVRWRALFRNLLGLDEESVIPA